MSTASANAPNNSISEWCSASVHELRAALTRGDITPVQLLDAHIDRIHVVQPAIRALVADRFTLAREEALRAEQQPSTARANLPLWGIPFTVKESFAVAGMPHTVGNLRRRHVVADTDATVVARLRAAGGIVLGCTNLPEMAMGVECDNLVYGRTNNPHALDRTCGGSSGGEGAIIAAGGSPFGVASDVGGSIRMPSLFCGISGHKPSGGLVPGTGHVPSPSRRAARFTAYGPMARHASDLPFLLSLMAGPDGHDPGCEALPLLPAEGVDLRGVRVHVVPDDHRHAIAPSMTMALWRAASVLQGRGAQVTTLHLPALAHAFDAWGDALKQTADRSFGSWLANDDNDDIGLLREWLLAARGRRRHTDAALLFVALERVSRLLPLVRGGLAKLHALREQLDALLGDNGVLLMPPYPTTAPKHQHSQKTPRGFVFSGLFNMLEMPSTAVPVGKDAANLPTGVQIIARRGGDHLTLAAAGVVDAALGAFSVATPPSP